LVKIVFLCFFCFLGVDGGIMDTALPGASLGLETNKNMQYGYRQ